MTDRSSWVITSGVVVSSVCFALVDRQVVLSVSGGCLAESAADQVALAHSHGSLLVAAKRRRALAGRFVQQLAGNPMVLHLAVLVPVAGYLTRPHVDTPA